jgi:hypothetical protein
LRGVDVDFRQFLDGNTIFVFSHKQDIIYDMKLTTFMGQKITLNYK